MFDISQIASLSGSTIEEVRTTLPSLLQSIRDYTNRSFITSIGVIDTINVDYTDEVSTITIQNDTFESFKVGDLIELRYSPDNRYIYTISEISVDYKTLTLNEKVYPEEFYGVVIKLSFPIYETLLSDMIKYNKSKLVGLISESLDGYAYQLEAIGNSGYPKSIISNVSQFRQLPGSQEREYRNAGFDIYSIQRYRPLRTV